MIILNIVQLKQHEEIDKNHLKQLKNKINNDGVFKEPIIVDKDNLVVLDGHHRLNSCKQLGLSKIPCLLVNYLHNDKIKVTTRRENYQINKEIIIKMGLSNKLFPKKTTKHYIPYRIKNLKIPLSRLY